MKFSKTQVALNSLMRILQVLLGVAGWVGAGFILGLHLRSDFQPFLSMILASGLGVIAAVVHEGGHYLGARLHGMQVLMMRVAAVEIQVRRRNWQIRWSPQLKGRSLGGYVMAVPNLQVPLRQQMLWIVLMGPMANLLMGLAASGLGWFTEGLMSAFFLAFAMLNLGMGLANLVPTSRILPSDGRLLITWWQHRDDKRADLAQTRLLAMSVAGVACEQLPDSDIAQLSQGAMPQPLIALSYRLSALLNQGDFQAAAQLEEHLEAVLQDHTQSLEGIGTLITLLRVEFAFVRAYLEQDVRHLWNDWTNRDLDWYCPWLRPRSAALREFLQGDLQQAERYLQQALATADNSILPTTRRSEALMADSLRALSAAVQSKGLEPEREPYPHLQQAPH
ncbi:M50 family metallopeptidase [Pseudomonas cichorii]|uniref:M50 family metallopeptidase n=1 Tax=Pseudomonas cichorii TaxID=36746 RepID=UPI001C88F7AE|nr:M50 family metallopeptidase [Pseudomonas cichorii]MBX8573660.1 site-2 protease family protein [Pseudomonas cichorii]